jgi:hypothetical protein
VDPLATYAASLQCWNWSDFREGGGVPFGRLVVWPDHLEMTTRGILKVFFRARTVPKERVRLIRPLQFGNPAHRVILAMHPVLRRREVINLVVSAPKEQSENTGNIHYVLGIGSSGAAQALDALDRAGFQVSRTPLRLTTFNIAGQLSWLDVTNRPGRR